MRLIIVDLGHAWGGAQRWALRLAQAWLGEGEPERSLQVISPHDQFAGIASVFTNVSPGRRGLMAASKALQGCDIENSVVLLNSFPAVYLACRAIGAPVLAWLHEPLIGPATPFWKRPPKLALRVASLVRVNRVICVGEGIRASVPSMFAKKSEVILNGVLDPEIPPQKAADAWRVAFIGRLDPVKRVHLLIAAVAQVRASLDRPVLLTIAGDGPERSRLEEIVQRAGLQDAVRFLGEVANVRAVLADCDVFVLPSIQEGMPLTILEAFAGRRPVIGFAVPGVRELLHNGETGILCPDGDVDALAGALRNLAQHPQLVTSLSENARRTWETRHREETMIQRSLLLLRETASSITAKAGSRRVAV
jgi:glycosyltransferase involved in cell wall biosynthesis